MRCLDAFMAGARDRPENGANEVKMAKANMVARATAGDADVTLARRWLSGPEGEKAESLELSDWIKQAVREKKQPLPESETANNEKTTPNVDGAGARQDMGGSPNNRGAYAERRRHDLRTRRLAFDCMSRNAR